MQLNFIFKFEKYVPNALSPIFSTDFGTVRLSSLLHPAKDSLPIDIRCSGRSILLSSPQLSKRLSHIESKVYGNLVLFSEWHPEKAFSSISLTLWGMEISFNPHDEKALFSILSSPSHKQTLSKLQQP